MKKLLCWMLVMVLFITQAWSYEIIDVTPKKQKAAPTKVWSERAAERLGLVFLGVIGTGACLALAQSESKRADDDAGMTVTGYYTVGSSWPRQNELLPPDRVRDVRRHERRAEVYRMVSYAFATFAVYNLGVSVAIARRDASLRVQKRF